MIIVVIVIIIVTHKIDSFRLINCIIINYYLLIDNLCC